MSYGMPQHYRRDGTLYIDTPEKPAFLQWAEDFENIKTRHVAVDETIYGERLSTVFLGLDHSFSCNPLHVPILFETMLFAPRSDEMRKAMRDRLSRASSALIDGGWDAMEWEETKEEQRIEKNFPHDQLQLRYATEREAQDGHEKLKLQCLIPPRWRRFLLYRIGGDETWE